MYAATQPVGDIADRGLASGLADSTVAAEPLECINFVIGDDQYGVDIMSVREIKVWSNVTHLPKQPDYVRGVLDLRGVVVPIIDLRCRFGQGPTDCTPTHIIIIVQLEGRQMGLLADRVLDIVSVEQSAVQSVPTVARSSRARFLAGLRQADRADRSRPSSFR